MWPQRRQPTRLPRPWDSPGKNTGVGCHCLLQCMKVKSESEVAQSCSTLCYTMDYSPPGFSVLRIILARIRNGLPCPPPGDLPWSLWYSVFLLSILKSQILLHFKWSCGPLFPKCNTVLLTFHLGVGGWSMYHNLKMLTMLENSHILGCWDPGPSYPGIKPTSRVSCTEGGFFTTSVTSCWDAY